jgi:hypothetical protein
VSGLGQFDRVLATDEQLDAEFVLEPGDSLGERLLAQEQPRGGPAEM